MYKPKNYKEILGPTILSNKGVTYRDSYPKHAFNFVPKKSMTPIEAAYSNNISLWGWNEIPPFLKENLRKLFKYKYTYNKFRDLIAVYTKDLDFKNKLKKKPSDSLILSYGKFKSDPKVKQLLDLGYNMVQYRFLSDSDRIKKLKDAMKFLKISYENLYKNLDKAIEKKIEQVKEKTIEPEIIEEPKIKNPFLDALNLHSKTDGYLRDNLPEDIDKMISNKYDLSYMSPDDLKTNVFYQPPPYYPRGKEQGDIYDPISDTYIREPENNPLMIDIFPTEKELEAEKLGVSLDEYNKLLSSDWSKPLQKKKNILKEDIVENKKLEKEINPLFSDIPLDNYLIPPIYEGREKDYMDYIKEMVEENKRMTSLEPIEDFKDDPYVTAYMQAMTQNLINTEEERKKEKNKKKKEKKYKSKMAKKNAENNAAGLNYNLKNNKSNVKKTKKVRFSL